MKKYILLRLDIKNDVYFHSSLSIHEITFSKNISKWADKKASKFYGAPTSFNKKSGWYEFHDGEIACKVGIVYESSYEDYRTFQKYEIDFYG